jgi:hypothetical protein
MLFGLFFLRDGAAAFPPLPVPNGYDNFVVAGNLMSEDTNDASTMDIEPLRAFIATNDASLRLLHLGLTRTCSVHAAEVLTNIANWSSDILATKRLAQFGIAVGRLAELEGRTNDAATVYVTGIRYGNEISRGGFLIHRLVGIACEAMARSRLTSVVTNLSKIDMRGIIHSLEKLETEAVSWAEIIANERMFGREAAWQIKNPIMIVQSWWSLRPAIKKAKGKHLRASAQRRLLLVELALRCHAVTHEEPPTELSELVPEHLARVPLDPFTDRALIYRPTSTNWLLYSVGADRVDNGGAGDDLRYDSK